MCRHDKGCPQPNWATPTLQQIIEDDWQPYHEIKEIRPENAGELWDKDGCKYITFGTDNNDLRIFNQVGGEYELSEFIPDGPIHDKYGWTRLYPKIEDDVERIEIEGVKWIEATKSLIYPSGVYEWRHLINRSPMKMILETPKDKT